MKEIIWMDNGLPPLHKCWGKIRTLLKKEIDLKTIFYCSCWRSQLCYYNQFSLLYDRWRGASSCVLKSAERSLEDCMSKWNQNALHAREDEGHRFCVNKYPAMALLHYSCVQLKEERLTGHLSGTGRMEIMDKVWDLVKKWEFSPWILTYILC